MDDRSVTTAHSAFTGDIRLYPAGSGFDFRTVPIRSYDTIVQSTLHSSRGYIANLDLDVGNTGQTPTRRLFRQDLPNDASFPTFLYLFPTLRPKRHSLSRLCRYDLINVGSESNSSIDESRDGRESC